jgi:NitT/TauT family transport system ATP-binding protein
MTTLLSVIGVSKVYLDTRGRRVPALEDANFEINAGEIIAIIGPSGCGKSTLLRILAGLDQNYSGKVSWETPPKSGKDIGFVFQTPSLLPWRNVFRNVAIGLENKSHTKNSIKERVDHLLNLVNLTEFKDSFPNELSGGMQQRVAIARALAYEPKVLLMDEPFGALDAITRDKLQDELLSIWEKTAKTIVLVTHSVEEATYLADKVIVMSNRPGKIKSIHKVPLLRNRSAHTRELPEFAKFTGLLRSEL